MMKQRPSAPAERPIFNVILEHAEVVQREEAVTGLSNVLVLDREHAAYIIDCAPILLLGKMRKSDIKALTSKLTELSKTGLVFRITARIPEKIPRLLWPAQPCFTIPTKGAVASLGFIWENARFVCPNCNEMFVLKRVGDIPLKEAVVRRVNLKPAVAPPDEIAPLEQEGVAAAATEEGGSAHDTKVDGEREESDENIEALKGQLDLLEKQEISRDPQVFRDEPFPLELPNSAEEPPLSDLDAQIVQEVTEIEPLIEEPEIMEPSPAVMGEGEVTQSGGLAIPSAPPAGSAEPTSPMQPLEEPKMEDIDTTGERYNVLLSKIVSKGAKEKAIPLIMETAGLAEKQARELAEKPMIVVARGVSKREGEAILDRFRDIKIAGRLTVKR